MHLSKCLEEKPEPSYRHGSPWPGVIGSGAQPFNELASKMNGRPLGNAACAGGRPPFSSQADYEDILLKSGRHTLSLRRR